MDLQPIREDAIAQADRLRVNTVRIHPIIVSPKTTWTCVVVETTEGLCGIGEATIFKGRNNFEDIARGFQNELVGRPLAHIHDLKPQDGNLAAWAVFSAIEQAHWDILGKEAEKPAYALLGQTQRTSVPLYANINRRTRDRSPRGFTDSVQKARAEGFNKVKIAPFDDMVPGCGHAFSLYQKAADRIRAAHEALDGQGTLMVDCHWRLGRAEAENLLTLASELELGWIECPLPETKANLPALRTYRQECASAGIAVAGAEQGTSLSYFKRIIQEGIYDIIMPDVKYAGGLNGLLEIARLAKETDTVFSPHNPSGPVAHLASLHAMAVIDGPHLLEHQFDEDPLFWKLTARPMPGIRNGLSELPDQVGMGFSLPSVFAASTQ